MDINMVHWYSNFGEKLFCFTYDALVVNLIEMLLVCDSYTKSKGKARALRKKTYTRYTNT